MAKYVEGIEKVKYKGYVAIKSTFGWNIYKNGYYFAKVEGEKRIDVLDFLDNI